MGASRPPTLHKGTVALLMRFQACELSQKGQTSYVQCVHMNLNKHWELLHDYEGHIFSLIFVEQKNPQFSIFHKKVDEK